MQKDLLKAFQNIYQKICGPGIRGGSPDIEIGHVIDLMAEELMPYISAKNAVNNKEARIIAATLISGRLDSYSFMDEIYMELDNGIISQKDVDDYYDSYPNAKALDFFKDKQKEKINALIEDSEYLEDDILIKEYKNIIKEEIIREIIE